MRARGVLRAVGDPRARFEEDALRMVRAVRLSATLGFGVEAGDAGRDPGTRRAGRAPVGRADRRRAGQAAGRSGAVGRAPAAGGHRPAGADLAGPRRPARRCPQNKIDGEDLWDHTLRSVDAVAADRPVVRLAALLHDIGKPATFADGHFVGHDAVGADLAGAFLDRLREPRAVRDRVVDLVRHHMFSYEPNWSDAAVRRFIGKMAAIGAGHARGAARAARGGQRRARGCRPEAGRLDELRARVAAELAAEVVLDRGRLALDGTDLITELGLEEGPLLGRILDDLLEAVIADPARQRAPDAAPAGPGHADGGPMIELLLQAERALSVGMLDRAETLYRQVANADPRNSIAVVGLARVTLDRGDEEGALALARRALEIDPENDAAIRLVARLEEVIDYRHESAAAALGLEEPAAERAEPEIEPESAAEPEADEPSPRAPSRRPSPRSSRSRRPKPNPSRRPSPSSSAART